MKKMLIILSVVLNVVLITALYYVACVKTDFSKRMMAKIKHEAYVPERTDGCCVDSWNNCIEKMDMQVDIVFFGDSHIAGGDFQKAFPNMPSINLGYIGEDTKGMLRRVDAITAMQPKKVFLMGGINGLSYQSLNNFAYWYAALVDSIRAAVPNAEIYVHTLLPVTASSDYCDNTKIIEANKLISRIAADRNFTLIDLHNRYADNNALPDNMSCDGLHLTNEAYNLWYQAIAPYIKHQSQISNFK